MFCVALTRSLPQPPSVHLFPGTVNCNDVIKELSIDSHFVLFDLLSTLVSGLQETFACICNSKLFSTISGLRIASHTINNEFLVAFACFRTTSKARPHSWGPAFQVPKVHRENTQTPSHIKQRLGNFSFVGWN